jgi:hypothetical protein
MMRVSAVALIMFASSVVNAAESNGPSALPYDGIAATCRTAAQRDLEDYFRTEFREPEVFVEIEYVFLDPSRNQDLPPIYYVWARASNRDAKKYRAGAARVVTTRESNCVVTGLFQRQIS